MGCDGGTIPRRDELVRVKKKPEQKDKESELAYRWRHCALTQQRLQEPIVMCGLGRLYSKQNIIEQLLDKEKEMPDSCKHIKSLRDIKNLVLTPNPAYKDEDKTEGLLDVRSAPYICKLIGLEMTGRFRFVALWTCGCVFSERALKEIGTKVCSLCQTPFAEEDVVILNGNEDETALMAVKMEARIARRKAEKKSKSSKKNATATAAEITTTIKKEEEESTIALNDECSKSNDEKISAGKIIKTETIKTEKQIPSKAGTSSLPSKQGLSQHKVLKRTAPAEALLDPEMKKLKEGGSFSVAADPKATDVYKSIFTSHKSAQEQDRAHWVTYNPFYN